MKYSFRTVALVFALFTGSFVFAQTVNFHPTNDFSISNNPLKIASKDINGDNKPDMLIIFANSNQLAIYMNTTAPGASTASYSARQDLTLYYYALNLIVEDFDGDNKPDILVTYINGPSVFSGFTNTTTPGSMTASFSPRTEFSCISGASAVACGDFNNDGRLDVAQVHQLSNVTTIYYNSPLSGNTGWYMNNGGWNLAAPSNPNLITVADINNDGKDDIILSTTNGTVTTLVNQTPQGNYSIYFMGPQVITLSGTSITQIGSADMNNDGKKDLLLSDVGASTIKIILNNTTISSLTTNYAAPQSFSCGTNPISLAIADMNKDGKLDIISNLGGSPFNSNSLLRNSTSPGAATLSFETIQEFTTNNYPSNTVVTDINMDGKPDLGIITNTAFLQVMLNATTTGSTTPSFTGHFDLSATSPVIGTSGDLNNDGKPDLILANGTSNTISIFSNTTASGSVTPTYASRQDIGGFNNPVFVAIVDFTQDGKKDILVVNKNNGYLGVLVNYTTPGSSIFTFNLQYFGSMGTPQAVALGDLNGDDKIDLVASATNGGLYFFFNYSNPGSSSILFSSFSFYAGGICNSLMLTDLNGDGKLDVTAAVNATSSINIWVNNTPQGYGNYQNYGQQIVSTIDNPTGITATDINMDGKMDLALTNDHLVGVHLNLGAIGNPSISLTPKKEFNTGTGIVSNSLQCSDINSDGLQDLAFVNKASNAMVELQNSTVLGTVIPNFENAQNFTTGTDPSGLFLFDLNLDNKIDALTFSTISNQASVLLNTTSAALPVTFLDFNGKRIEQLIELEWTCSAEWNNKAFTIQRSADGRNWTSIGSINGTIEGNFINKYHFTDMQPLKGKNYYRLRQEDFSLAFNYSKIILVSMITEETFLLNNCLPNPFTNSTTIRYRMAITSRVTIRIHDASGKEIVVLKDGISEKGDHTLIWNASLLPHGVYYVKMVTDKYTASKKIIKIE